MRLSSFLALALLFLTCLPTLCSSSPIVVSGKKYDLQLTDLRFFIEKGKGNDWSRPRNLIAFEKYIGNPFLPPDQYRYDVYVVEPTGVNLRCLTCGLLPGHSGSPAFSPDGNWIIFTGECPESAPINAIHNVGLSGPGAGINNDLYIISVDPPTQLHRLTNFSYVTSPFENPRHAILHPAWSNDGSKVFWAEEYDSGPWIERPSCGGSWRLQLADLEWDGSIPRLANIESIDLAPFSNFYESHQFSIDDRKLLFCSDLIESQTPDYTWDIYEYDYVARGEPKRLTSNLDAWDEHAHYDSTGTKILWMSSKGYGDYSEMTANLSAVDYLNFIHQVKAELWGMDADGTHKQQLTFINVKEHEHFITDLPVLGEPDNSWVADSSISPDGGMVAMAILYHKYLGFDVVNHDLYLANLTWIERPVPTPVTGGGSLTAIILVAVLVPLFVVVLIVIVVGMLLFVVLKGWRCCEDNSNLNSNRSVEMTNQ